MDQSETATGTSGYERSQGRGKGRVVMKENWCFNFKEKHDGRKTEKKRK